MTHFSLAYLAGKWDKVQYNPDIREIKYMPEMPPADENRSITKQFGEFRIADFKHDRCCAWHGRCSTKY